MDRAEVTGLYLLICAILASGSEDLKKSITDFRSLATGFKDPKTGYDEVLAKFLADQNLKDFVSDILEGLGGDVADKVGGFPGA